MLKDLKKYNNIKTLTGAILLMLGTGALLLTAIAAPNAMQMLKPFLKKGKRAGYERDRIYQAINALRRRRLVEISEKDGQTLLQITERGITRVRKFDIENTKLPVGRWDHKWHLIFFDIPEQRRKARYAFQKHIKSLGCLAIQRSVYVYPYACRDEIDFVASFWEVEPFVHYAVTDDLGKLEGKARKFFELI